MPFSRFTTCLRTSPVVALFLSQGAAAAPGDLLVTEYGSGTVANATMSGDISGEPKFATGLNGPTGLCQGPGGDIFVAETDGDEVTIITEGGAFDVTQAFATGLNGPIGLFCDAAKVYVAEQGRGQVTDITAGGDFTEDSGIGDLDSINHVFVDSGGRLFLSAFYGGIHEVDGGVVTEFVAIGSAGLQGMDEFGGKRYFVDSMNTVVREFSVAGTADSQPLFATVPKLYAIHAIEDTLYALTGNGILDISEGGDFSLAGNDPIVTGLNTSYYWSDLLHVRGCGDGIVTVGEDCDEGDIEDGDGCSSTCQTEAAGSGGSNSNSSGGGSDSGSGATGGENSSDGGASSGSGGSGSVEMGGEAGNGDPADEETFVRNRGCTLSASQSPGRNSWVLWIGLVLGVWIARRRPGAFHM